MLTQKRKRQSDRIIARIVGMSQPTVTRCRNLFEEKGIIQSYQVIPDFNQIGYRLFALSLIEPSPEDIDLVTLRLKAKDEIIFQANHRGTIVTLSVHKDYSQYESFLTGISAEVKTLCLGLTANITKTFEIAKLHIEL